MLSNKFFLICAIAAIQIAIIFLIFHRRSLEIIQRKLYQKVVIIFLGVQILSVLLILLGGYSETKWKFYTKITKLADKYRYPFPETFNVEGDPNLLKWLGEQRPSLPRPDFSDGDSIRTWQASLRQTLHEVFGISDFTTPISVKYHKISSTVVGKDITRTFLAFDSFDGTSIPGYLFIPKIKGPKPAIIVLHGHVDEYEDGISQTAGLVNSYHNKAALELAKAGYITLTIEFRGFGYLGSKINTEHRLVAYNAILGGSFYKAIISKDIKYAFDLLQSLDEVDPGRIGITGVSFGGEMAVTYAALDERIKATVFQGFGEPPGVMQGIFGTSLDQPHYCHIIPGYNTHLLQEDMFFLIAPRPLLGVKGNLDYLVDPIFSGEVRKAYTALNASSSFRFETVAGGHSYDIQSAIEFFKQNL